MSTNDRDENLGATVEGLRRRFGPGVVMRLGEGHPEGSEIEVIPTGLPELDVVLGVGGWPRGRVVEVFGPAASAKTALALRAVAEAQARGGTAALIDTAHTLDVHYAKSEGVRTEHLLVSQPDNGEQALEVAEALARSRAVDLIVVDAVESLIPAVTLEGQLGDAYQGLHARLMSQALRKLTAVAGRTGSVVIFLSRTLPSRIALAPDQPSGGNALKFYASVRLETLLREGSLRLKVVKNKFAPPFQSVEVPFPFAPRSA